MSDLPVLGIDLGTTYSCVARLDELKPVALLNSDGDYTTPSVVFFEDDGSVVVGKNAKNDMGRAPERVIQHIKRKMGVPDFYVEIDQRPYYPPQISSLILESIVSDAREAIGLDVPEEGLLADVVITVPAYFGGAERSATKSAGEQARLNVLGIINEPTAAAVAHGLTSGAEKRTVLVYDLGGGTFDVTVVEASNEVIKAIATGGDRELGGVDWDVRLKSWVLDRYRDQHPEAPDPDEDTEAVGELDLKVESAKQALSKNQKYNMNFTANMVRGTYEITRDVFEELTADLVERTMHQTEIVLDEAARKGVDHLDEVIMVGGMSKMPVLLRTLEERLRDRFGTAPTPRITDPDQIVAKGAALFASSAVAEAYVSNEDQPSVPSRDNGGRFLPGPTPAVPKIVNITSRGYGIKAVDGEHDTKGHVEWLIKPNDELPASPQREFSTVHENQTEVHIEVFQSATNVLNDDIDVNDPLVDGMLTGLPGRKPAGQPIDITFSLGDEGILEIVALTGTGQRLKLEYKLPGETPAEELAKPLPSIARR